MLGPHAFDNNRIGGFMYDKQGPKFAGYIFINYYWQLLERLDRHLPNLERGLRFIIFFILGQVQSIFFRRGLHLL